MHADKTYTNKLKREKMKINRYIYRTTQRRKLNWIKSGDDTGVFIGKKLNLLTN